LEPRAHAEPDATLLLAVVDESEGIGTRCLQRFAAKAMPTGPSTVRPRSCESRDRAARHAIAHATDHAIADRIHVSVLRSRKDSLCIPDDVPDPEENSMNSHKPSTFVNEPDLHLVTLHDAAKYLAVSRGALYALLSSGELGSIHIGRARRIPMVELQRFVRERLSA
jgi:excisionase family DNA binding protein